MLSSRFTDRRTAFERRKYAGAALALPPRLARHRRTSAASVTVWLAVLALDLGFWAGVIALAAAVRP